MSVLKVLCICAALGMTLGASGQGRGDRIYKAAVVALTNDPALRADFERQLAAKAREHNYDAVTSYDLVPTVTDVDNREFVDTMLANKVDLVLLLRPAADRARLIARLRAQGSQREDSHRHARFRQEGEQLRRR